MDQLGPHAETLRRVLLAWLVALLVARPLVLGEDPGMLQPFTSTSSLFLLMGWLILLVGWAWWRWKEQRTTFQAGAVEMTLLLAVLGVACSALVAPYQHPAILITWEWLGLLVALFLVRQLAENPEDQRRLVAVLLASAVAVSVQAAYEMAFERPLERQRQVVETPAEVHQATALLGTAQAGPLPLLAVLHPLANDMLPRPLAEEDASGQVRAERSEAVHSSFATGSTFAAYLALFVPALLVATVLAHRQRVLPWQAKILAAMLAFAFAALVLAQGVHAWAGLAIVAAFVGLIAYRYRRLALNSAAAIAFVAVVVALGLEVIGAADRDENRSDYWSAAVAMFRSHPWLGVGAGNFGRVYPQFMEARAYETIAEPHNFILELASTYGIVTLLAVLAAIIAFMWLVLQRHAATPLPTESAPAAPPNTASAFPAARTPWEYYGGGVLGLLLGYLLAQVNRSPEALLFAPVSGAEEFLHTLVTVMRGLVWLAAFALFELVRWPGRTLAYALAAGVGACLFQFCFAGGIAFPSVALMLWVVIGLALASLALPARPVPFSPKVASFFYLPIAVVVLVFFCITVLGTVVSGALSASEALVAWQKYAVERRRTANVTVLRQSFERRIIRPLEDATRQDRGNARWQLHLALANAELWRLYAAERRGIVTRSILERNQSMLKLSQQLKPFADQALTNALAAAVKAEKLDPNDREAFITHHDLRLMFARELSDAESRVTQQKIAIESLRRLLVRDPRHPRLHYRLAVELAQINYSKEALEAADSALYHDRESDDRSPRKLSQWQRQRLESWFVVKSTN